jgi:flagellar biosynthesis anti-sigma factor FlgM
MKISSIPSGDMVESYKGKTVQSVQKTERNVEPDRVELSDDAKSFASVIKEVKDSLETDTDFDKKHVEEVAKRIANGTYRIDSAKVAEKILGGNFDATV